MKKIEVPFLRTPYNYDTKAASDESGLDCSVEPSKTQQSFAKEVDINEIVRRFGLTGELPSGMRMPLLGDFTDVGSFQDCLNAMISAEHSFMALPADIRATFDNDPSKFVAFAGDEKNFEQMEKWGFVKPDATVRRQAAAAAAATKAAAGAPAAPGASPAAAPKAS